MATGDLRRPTKRQRRRIDEAVAQAEATTGLQLCVVLGRGGDRDPRAQAEEVFVDAGLVARPAVLLVVDPTRRHIEVVTSPSAMQRIPDDAAEAAVTSITARFGSGDLTGGLIAGIGALAAAAGPGATPPGASDLPNVVGDG